MTPSFDEFQKPPSDMAWAIKNIQTRISAESLAEQWYFYTSSSLVESDIIPPYLDVSTQFVCTTQFDDFTVSIYRGKLLNWVWKVENEVGEWFQYVDIDTPRYISEQCAHQKVIMDVIEEGGSCAYVRTTSEANQKFFETWYAMQLLLKSS